MACGVQQCCVGYNRQTKHYANGYNDFGKYNPDGMTTSKQIGHIGRIAGRVAVFDIAFYDSAARYGTVSHKRKYQRHENRTQKIFGERTAKPSYSFATEKGMDGEIRGHNIYQP